MGQAKYVVLSTTVCLLLVGASVTPSILSVLRAPAVHADIAPTQLVARWTFDGVASGENAPDSIGSNTAYPGGVEESSPQPSSDVPPVSYTDTASMQFDGSNFFTINNPVATNFTICAWIKTMSSGGGSEHWTSAPIMDSEVGGVAYDFGFGVGNGGKLMFGNGGVHLGNDPAHTAANWDAQINGTTTINNNAWHNVCVTRDGGTGQNILYVDAEVDGSGYSGIGTQTQNSYARIGWGYDGAALYQGLIDDVRVYDGVLTQAQLANLTAGSDNPDSAPTYVLSFDTQGGSAVAAYSPAESGAGLTLPGAPARSGFTFTGWNTAQDGTGTNYVAGASYTMPSANTTLYAIWQEVVTTDDNDGVSEMVEQAAPHNGDGNGDGIQDSEQTNVASLPTSTGSYVTLAVDNACDLSTVSARSVSETADAGYIYPYGMVDFTADCGAPGYTATIKQYYFGATTDTLVARKYNLSTGRYTDIPGATITDVVIGGQSAKLLTYQVSDGGVLDSDGAVNGVIVDPAGLALATTGSETALAYTGDDVIVMRAASGMIIGMSTIMGVYVIWSKRFGGYYRFTKR